MMNKAIKRLCEPPGYYIKEELGARGWTQTDLAYILQMKPQQLSPILSGKTGITANMAVLLGDAFDIPAEHFSALQAQYELSRAKPADPAIRKRAVWQSTFPLREMIERGWIEETDTSLLDAQMMRFFEVIRLKDVPCTGEKSAAVAHAAKKTNYESYTPEQIAWLYRVRQVARTIDAPSYDEATLRAVIGDLEGLRSDPEDAPEAVHMLCRAGVRTVVVEALPKSKIDGVCTWLNDQPVVALTNRFDRLDSFWFVLRHELEHVLCGHGKANGATAIDDDTTLSADATDEEERLANTAAADFCVPQSKLQSLIARKGNYVSEKDIVGFARRIGVHPSLVVGQYQYATEKWSFLRRYLSQSTCGVRKWLMQELESSNIIDGWGVSVEANL